MPPKLKILLVLTTVLLALDQVTKFWVYGSVDLGREELEVIPGFLSIVHAQNPGAALGLFTGFAWRIPLFLGFTGVAVWFLWLMYRDSRPDDRLGAAVIACILAGALGNFVDRVHKQTVTDFIRVYTESPGVVAFLDRLGLPSEWPTFNVADIAIVVGVALYGVHYVWVERREAAARKDAHA